MESQKTDDDVNDKERCAAQIKLVSSLSDGNLLLGSSLGGLEEKEDDDQGDGTKREIDVDWELLA